MVIEYNQIVIGMYLIISSWEEEFRGIVKTLQYTYEIEGLLINNGNWTSNDFIFLRIDHIKEYKIMNISTNMQKLLYK